MSGLGKGVTASSIGVLLKACGLRVTSLKIGKFNLGCQGRRLCRRVLSCIPGVTHPGAPGHAPVLYPADPYLNVDAGTMSPLEHGEVFVLDDGGEVCLSVHLCAGRAFSKAGLLPSSQHCAEGNTVPHFPTRPTWIWATTSDSWTFH